MVERRFNGLNGTFSFDDTPPPQRMRRSLFPTRGQVAELGALPLPQPRIMAQEPEPAAAQEPEPATAQATSPDADEVDSNDFDMADAPSPPESVLDLYSERRSIRPDQAHHSDTDITTVSPPPATTAAPPPSSFRTPTAPRPEGYKTPPHGPSCSPIVPPAQLATENSDSGLDGFSLEQSAPVTAAHPSEFTSAFRPFSSYIPTIPRPEDYEATPANLATENSDSAHDGPSLEQSTPVTAAHLSESTPALHPSSSHIPTIPRPEGHEATPAQDTSWVDDALSQFISDIRVMEEQRASRATAAQPTDENKNARDDDFVLPQATSAVREEPTAPRATSPHRTTDRGNGEHSELIAAVTSSAKKSSKFTPPPILGLIAGGSAQKESEFPLLHLPKNVIDRILDLLLVYDEPIALARKATHRRLVEATKSHIVTVGKRRIIREPQNKKMKSNVARTINTASPTNLFLVCRGLRNAGTKIYYNKNTFSFSREHSLVAWVESIGSRRKEVRKLELRSELEVVFQNNDIHTKDISFESTGFLHTTALRVFGYIKQVDHDIALRMPWQRTGKLPDYDKVSPDAQKMCSDFGTKMAKDMADGFKEYELNSPRITMNQNVWLDEAWVEPWYESAECKRRVAEDKRKLAAERAAERAAKASSGKDL